METEFRYKIVSIVILVLLIMIIFNPNKSSFTHWFMEKECLTSNDTVMVKIVTPVVYPSSNNDTSTNKKDISVTNFKRHNFLLFSIFKISSEDHKSYFFIGGVFGIYRLK